MLYRRGIQLVGLLMVAGALALVSSSRALANVPPHVPILQQPINGSIGVSLLPTLTWNASDPDNDPLTFDVYLGLTPDDAALVANNISSFSSTTGLLLGSTRYYWFVVARDPQGATATSAVWSFVTVVGPPPEYAVIPADQSVNQVATVTLDWSAFNPNSNTVQYELHLGTSGPAPYYATFTGTTTTIALQSYTWYYWSVVARDAQGTARQSPQWRFQTAYDHPTYLEPTVPADHAVNQPLHVTLGWAPSDQDNDPITYDVYLGVTIPPIKIASDVTTTVLDAGSLPYFLPLTRYYWQVVAKTVRGSTTGPMWSFTTRANSVPAQAFNPDPPDGGNAANPVLLTWQATDPDLPGQQLTYDIYFGINFQPPLVTWNQAAPNYAPGPLYPGLTYYWSISVSDGINVTWGPIWSFVATDSIVSGIGDAPTVTTLGRNRPNPFNPQTIIPYGVPNSGAPVHVRLVIYDTLGRVVRTLVDEQQSGGTREVVWKGEDQNGGSVASGVYYCVLRVGNERRTQKLVLLK